MGQRCAILLKKNFGNNKSEISLIHHQWGIGKILPSLVLQEVMKYVYPMDRSLNYLSKESGKLPIDVFFTFSPLSNASDDYIHKQEVKTDEVDVWDKATRVKYFNMTANNNGGVIIEVTQKYEDSYGRGLEPKAYGDSLEVKIGYVLGDEETHYYHENLKDSVKIEEDFERLVKCSEFVKKTFSTGNEDGGNMAFIKSYNSLCELFGIEHKSSKKLAKKVRDKITFIETVVEAHTKGLKEHDRIDVPKELLQPTPIPYK